MRLGGASSEMQCNYSQIVRHESLVGLERISSDMHDIASQTETRITSEARRS
jgi:hypothetical protein